MNKLRNDQVSKLSLHQKMLTTSQSENLQQCLHFVRDQVKQQLCNTVYPIDGYFILVSKDKIETGNEIQRIINANSPIQIAHVITDPNTILMKPFICISFEIPEHLIENFTTSQKSLIFIAQINQFGENINTNKNQIQFQNYQVKTAYLTRNLTPPCPSNSNRFTITSGTQFKHLFSSVFDFLAPKSAFQVINSLSFPPFLENIKEQNQIFCKKFINFLLNSFEFNQNSVDQLIYSESDEIAYQILHQLPSKAQENRLEKRVKELQNFLNSTDLQKNNVQFGSMLDLGCSSGELTELNAKLLGIDLKNVFGADVQKQNFNRNFTYIQCDFEKDSIDLNNGAVQLVIITQVLHHVQNQKHLIDEAFRVLQNNGYLIIKDCLKGNDINNTMLDIQHGIFAVVTEKMDYFDFRTMFKTNYPVQEELEQNLLLKFKILKQTSKQELSQDQFQKCWYLCQKIECQSE